MESEITGIPASAAFLQSAATPPVHRLPSRQSDLRPWSPECRRTGRSGLGGIIVRILKVYSPPLCLQCSRQRFHQRDNVRVVGGRCNGYANGDLLIRRGSRSILGGLFRGCSRGFVRCGRRGCAAGSGCCAAACKDSEGSSSVPAAWITGSFYISSVVPPLVTASAVNDN